MKPRLRAAPSPRLPIVQGGTTSYLIPTIAIISTRYEACEALPEDLTEAQRREVWQERMREIQGTIAVSAVVQVLVGFTGEEQRGRVYMYIQTHT